jgi:class 3 adenylate cyclase
MAQDLSIHTKVERSVNATILLIDLRNFTPNLNASREELDGVNAFCHFLSKFYADCLDSCLLVFPASLRPTPPLYMSSTGDGVLIVFSGDWHFGYGFLAGILLNATLRTRCAEYNYDAQSNGLPGTSFGIGIESGKVSRIYAHPRTDSGHPIIDTYIGHCINVAARAEGISKILYLANTIIASTTIELVASALFHTTFHELLTRERQCADDDERLALYDEINSLNRALCLSYIKKYILKGVDNPMSLYRFAPSAIHPGIERFEHLVERLVRGDHAHFTEMLEYLSGHEERYSRLSETLENALYE